MAPLLLSSGALLGAGYAQAPRPPAVLQAAASCPPLSRIRFFPRAGQAALMKGGRFVGSNENATTDFETIAEIKEAPREGEWSEISLDKPVMFRYIKYEAPRDSWGNVAEVEFYDGAAKIRGVAFGTQGSRDNAGNDFSKALDGDVKTFFDGVNASSQYVGLDLGAAAQAAPPQFTPRPGSYAGKQLVTIISATPNAKIRFTNGWGNPNRESGEEYKGPITIEAGTVLAAVAYTDALAASPVVVAPYRVGAAGANAKLVRTFHIGNSLTDSTHNVLEPLAASAGKSLEWHRFTIPGAPTDWLWDHPNSGFGDTKYLQAFFALSPLDHIITQPFHGHDRGIENEAEYSQKFFEAARKDSPGVQAWLYVQWTNPRQNDAWAQGKGSTTPLKLKAAATWQEGIANHIAYAEAVRDKINESYGGKPVRIVPAGLVLANLKTEIDAGRVPGLKDFFKDLFDDDIHLNARGRYAVALAHYAAFYGESAAGKASSLNTDLTAEQLAIFQRVAWDSVKGYKGAWPSEVGQALNP